MKRNDNIEKKSVRIGENDKYLAIVFALQKRANALMLSDRKARFNDTEICLLSEILFAEKEGKRLISTQLAKRLNITRSAVSQIVNRLEKEGVIVRIPDKEDRKIAYVAMAEETTELYNKELKNIKIFIGKVIKKYGVNKFSELCSMMNEFFDTIEEERTGKETKK